MNWKRIVLVVILGFFAIAFFTVAAVAFAATAALGTAAVAVSESGVVEAFEEVAADVERLQIETTENSVTFTDLDSGESRTITSGDRIGRGRVEFSLPELTITADESGRGAVQVLGQDGQIELQMPEIVITGPEGEQARITIPEVGRPDVDVRVPRVETAGDHHWSYELDRHYGPEQGLRIVGEIFSGLFTLTALLLIAAGAVLLLRNRRRDQAKLDQVKGDDNS